VRRFSQVSRDFFRDSLYAATLDSGIRRADILTLIDFMNWNQINDGAYDEVIALDNALLRWIWRCSFQIDWRFFQVTAINSIAHCGCDSVK
jgi:hypothetical protein